MIILKESDYARKMISEHNLGDNPTDTLFRVAKYYIYQGYSKSDTRKLINEFILRCDPDASLPLWSNTIDRTIKKALKHPCIDIESVGISTTEMDKINSLQKKPARRLAFTLLCLSKYWDVVAPHSNGWVRTPDNEILAMANIKTSVKYQSAIYRELKDAGLIQFSRKIDNTSVRVCFMDNSNPILHIEDFRNLGYQYLMYCGGPYFACQECGLVTKYKDPNNKRRQIYCTSCAQKMRITKERDAGVRRIPKTLFKDALSNSAFLDSSDATSLA